MFKTFDIVSIGSFFARGSRYLVSQIMAKSITIPFPFGSHTVNILGSFIIGLIFGLSIKTDLVSTEMKMLLATCFCGGFTNFLHSLSIRSKFLEMENYFMLYLTSGLLFQLYFLPPLSEYNCLKQCKL